MFTVQSNGFIIFTELCNYHYNLILEGFRHPQKKPHAHL